MNAELIENSFKERVPILKRELNQVLNIDNQNSLNQALSYLVSFGILKRYENGIYYIPSSNHKFSQLKPSLNDVVEKKYLDNDNGIRTGAYLLYKYKFTSQISSYYEILSNNVSTHTRSKHLYHDKVRVSYPPFKISGSNMKYLEFLEMIKYIHFSDFSIDESKKRLHDLIKQFKLNKEDIIEYSRYYKGRRYAGFRDRVKEIVQYEVASR